MARFRLQNGARPRPMVAQTVDVKRKLTPGEVQTLARAILAARSYFYSRRLLQRLERGELSVTEVLTRLSASQPRHPPHMARTETPRSV
jgi:hypothetical protein